MSVPGVSPLRSRSVKCSMSRIGVVSFREKRNATTTDETRMIRKDCSRIAVNSSIVFLTSPSGRARRM